MLCKLLLGCVLGTLGSIPALALSAPERLTIGMTLEPPALDPTANAAETIADVTLYNIYETLTKIQEDGSVTPLLAESWTVSDDGRTYTFRLRDGVRFHNGAAMDAQTVRYAFERAGAENSTNKDRRHFSQWQIDTPDPLTVQITLPQADPDLPFRLGMMTAAIVEPGSAGTNATQPTGTGPYQLAGWQRGSRLQLKKWPDYRNASQVALDEVTIRFISDPAAQAAALLAGDIDAFPRIQASRSLPRLQQDSRFDIVVGGSRAKTMMAINQRRAPLDDVRVRRAILAAIDRDAVIEGAADGYGLPIGSFYTPGTPGYVDTTGINPYDPAKARALLQEAGVAQPLRLDLLLPPPPYARQGGEIIAALLAQAGIQVRIKNVEWAQWLANVYGGAHDYDLTIVSHVEPLDLGNFANPDYYTGYDSAAFQQIYQDTRSAADENQRLSALQAAQRQLAEDAAAAFLYQPQWISIARKGLSGMRKDVPVFITDFATWRWQD
ncbi:peptide/nickel transport system substrate-binding protein [Kerstersia gyiorum]|uniref:Peptide/nickel transport system substrate-binding protein n=1 Tax=Kerstersia gyiorum TaxID=206506 RepID=A0A4Q7MXT1_9BURK|nr:ABC transporter substrate-binding protein [Kerstersia gyiorum]KAB0542684.1 ABC transporter substrate-binding protein [Kerstersia gyiorum]RZS73912.1 peptide/nickel transport system substrate-binding protein [Kerstersia gyiorum]